MVFVWAYLYVDAERHDNNAHHDISDSEGDNEVVCDGAKRLCPPNREYHQQITEQRREAEYGKKGHPQSWGRHICWSSGILPRGEVFSADVG